MRITPGLILKTFFNIRSSFIDFIGCEVIIGCKKDNARCYHKMIIKLDSKVTVIARTHNFMQFLAWPQTNDFMRHSRRHDAGKTQLLYLMKQGHIVV